MSMRHPSASVSQTLMDNFHSVIMYLVCKRTLLKRLLLGQLKHLIMMQMRLLSFDSMMILMACLLSEILQTSIARHCRIIR